MTYTFRIKQKVTMLLMACICMLQSVSAQRNLTTLRTQDHLVIMKSLIENLKELGQKKIINKQSTSAEILFALNKIEHLSLKTKGCITRFQNFNKLTNETAIPPELSAMVKEVIKRTSVYNFKSNKEYEKQLILAMNDHKYDKYPSIKVGLKTALAFYKDGKNSIYSAKYYSRLPGVKNKDFKDLESKAKEILEADKNGAIGGAAAGCVATVEVGCFPGAVTGAVTGGVVGSTAQSVIEFLDWLF